jgi:RNA polymerase sigma-70 factor (ECF subfamily)
MPAARSLQTSVFAGVCNVFGPPVTTFAWGRIASVATPARCDFDRVYVERLVAGHPETEQHFTRYFSDLLTMKLRSRLRSAALVEDAKQETFMRVLITLRQGKGLTTPESLGAFVNGVCNNVLFEIYRAQSRAIPLEDEHEPPDDRPESAERRLMAGEERARVRDAMLKLSDKDQKLLRWLFFEERSKDDICRLLNVDRNNLRVLLHRAKNRLRECLNDAAH